MAQNNQSQRNEFFKEVGKLLKNFIRRDFIKDELLQQPKNLQKKAWMMHTKKLITSFVFPMFSYLALAGNTAIEHGYKKTGVLLYLFFNAQLLVKIPVNHWYTSLETDYDYSIETFLNHKGGEIQSRVGWNVYQQVESKKWKQSTTEEITNSIINYLYNRWNVENNYLFGVLQIIMTVIMLLVTIQTNTQIPQVIFVPFLMISGLVELLCATYNQLTQTSFRTMERELNNSEEIIKNDILRVEPICHQDQEARLNRYSMLTEQHLNLKKSTMSTDLATMMISQTIELSLSSCLMMLYFKSAGTIDLTTVAGMTASLGIYRNAMQSVNSILKVLTERSSNWDFIEKEIPMVENILRVFYLQKAEKAETVDSLEIEPFENKYTETSENDKSFKLILDKKLSFKKGDCIALTGPSGSGKSTFLKVTTKRIRFKEVKQSKITPVNYVYYDESIDFGSMPLWDEIFCLDGKTRIKPTAEELAKMEYILKEMKLYQEISEQCKNFWTWLQENTSRSLSKGQKQRLIVSKILFWLNTDIDIVALDECTSGLDAKTDDDDNADALKILQFIINYCNHDKKRILFLATHQDIDNLCNHRLHFRRASGKTIIQKIR